MLKNAKKNFFLQNILWILGNTRTIFILLQVSFQFGMVHVRMKQDQNIKKYFQEPILRKIPFCENLLHTQHFVAYATRKCRVRNILLYKQHANVAYATFCCTCNMQMSHTQHDVAYATQKCHMQEDVAFAAYMCCICYKMFGMLVTCTVLATYLVICLKTTWLSKSSILN